MKIAVLGTGVVGKTIATRLAGLGHQVVIGTRDPAATLARTEPDYLGGPPVREFLESQPALSLASFAEAAQGAELIVNATGGRASLPALEAAGHDNLAGKVVLDISNPLDFGQGFPPSLLVANTDSLAEQLQRAVPQARIVKTLNTLTVNLMVEPDRLGGGEHSVFVSGDDAAAKATATELLRSFGWRDVIDLGDLSTARGAEMYVAFWVRLMPALGGTGQFNIKVVR